MSKENNKEENEKKITKKTVTYVKKDDLDKDVNIKNFDNLEGKFLLVRVGNDKKPATQEQIDNVESSLLGLFEKNNVNCLTFVTHHAVDVTIFW